MGCCLCYAKDKDEEEDIESIVQEWKKLHDKYGPTAAADDGYSTLSSNAEEDEYHLIDSEDIPQQQHPEPQRNEPIQGDNAPQHESSLLNRLQQRLFHKSTDIPAQENPFHPINRKLRRRYAIKKERHTPTSQDCREGYEIEMTHADDIVTPIAAGHESTLNISYGAITEIDGVLLSTIDEESTTD